MKKNKVQRGIMLTSEAQNPTRIESETRIGYRSGRKIIG
jgi:hypothetical protein